MYYKGISKWSQLAKEEESWLLWSKRELLTVREKKGFADQEPKKTSKTSKGINHLIFNRYSVYVLVINL